MTPEDYPVFALAHGQCGHALAIADDPDDITDILTPLRLAAGWEMAELPRAEAVDRYRQTCTTCREDRP